MKPPSVIYIGAADYEIVEKKHVDLLGEADNNNTRLVIKRGQSAPCKRDTVLHEILHAIIFVAGFRVKYDHEEEIVRTLSPWILGVLRDNPELVSYLTEDARG